MRKYSLEKIPFILAVGKKELEENTVSVRQLGSKKQEIVDLDTFIGNIAKEAQPPK